MLSSWVARVGADSADDSAEPVEACAMCCNGTVKVKSFAPAVPVSIGGVARGSRGAAGQTRQCE